MEHARPWHALKVSYPVIGTESFFLISWVTRPRIIESLHGRQARRVAVATLVRQIATETLSIALLVGDRSAMDNMLRPFGRGLHPLNQLADVIAPLQVLLRIQKNIARVFERDDLVHIRHAGRDIFKVSDPDIILHRIL